MLTITVPVAILLLGTLILRRTIAALAAAVLAAAVLAHGPLQAPRELLRAGEAVLLDVFNVKLLLFVVLVGSFTTLVEHSGIARSFELASRRFLVTPARTELFTSLLGVPLAIDDYFNSVTRAVLVRDAADHAKIERGRLSYLIHATALSLPVMLPLSTAALFVVGLLRSAGGIPDENPILFYAGLIPLCCFPAFSTLTALLASAPMGARTKSLPLPDPEERAHANAFPMLAAVGTLFMGTLLAIPLSGALFGARDWEEMMLKSDVSGALLSGVVLGLVVASTVALRRFGCRPKVIAKLVMKGAREMGPVAAMILLSWLLGKITAQSTEANRIIADGILRGPLPEFLLPALLFAAASLFTFVMGGAWSAWAILIPLSAPHLAQHGPEMLTMGMAAILSGVVLGECLCPFSDLTLLIAKSCDIEVADHIRAQWKFAGMAALAALVAHLLIPWSISLGWAAGVAVVLGGRPWRATLTWHTLSAPR